MQGTVASPVVDGLVLSISAGMIILKYNARDLALALLLMYTLDG